MQFLSLYIFQQRKRLFFVKIYISGQIWLQRAVLSVNYLAAAKTVFFEQISTFLVQLCLNVYFEVFTFCRRQNCVFALKSIFDDQFEFNVQFLSLYIFQQRKRLFFVKIYISGQIWLQRAVLSVNILQQPKLCL